MNENKKAVLEDIKALKNYLLGVIAFAGAVAAFLIKVVNLPEAETILGIAGVAILMLVIGFLIQRSESRQSAALTAHTLASDKIVAEIHKNMLDNQQSNLRTEMNLMMFTNPSNHDTILKMAHRYFEELNGNWVETDLFLSWVDSEEEAGRKVHIPPSLANIVRDLRKKEGL